MKKNNDSIELESNSNMDELNQLRSRQKAQGMKNSHHYRVELYYTVIDM